ncbi:MAG: serine/threonine-protein kinase [Bradymonadia bacterium]
MSIPSALGPYAVEDQIGVGGMAQVLSGRHRYLDRLVALKMRLRTSDEQEGLMADRFRLGAFMQARLEHPNIARVFDYLESPEHQVIVMEFLGGGSIEDHLTRQQGALPVGDCVRIAIKAAEALQYAHEQGVVHRDIKPGNLMLLDDEDAETLRVTDFGVAKRVGHNHNLTLVGANVGTLWYMPPEQFNSEAPTPAVDVYGLGATLYEMLTGHIPFRAAEHAELFRRFLDGEPPPSIQGRSPDVPDDLVAVVLWAIELEAANRLPSAQAFAGLLLAVAARLDLLPRAHPAIADARARMKTAADAAEQIQGVAREELFQGLERVGHWLGMVPSITHESPRVDAEEDDMGALTLPPSAFAHLEEALSVQDTAPPYDDDEDRTVIMDFHLDED